MGGRVYRAGVITPPSLPTGRVYSAGVAGTAPAAAPAARIYRAAVVGTVPATVRGRLYAARIVGTAAVILASIPDRTVEPGSKVEITALLIGGTPALSYTWRQISGPPVTFTGTGHSRSFTAPSALDGVAIVVGVRATVGGTTSEESAVTITALPQIVWIRTDADPIWRGAKVAF